VALDQSSRPICSRRLACSVTVVSWYAESRGSFNKTYESLGVVIGVMIWLCLSTAVILFDAKLNAEMELQTARDTTERPITFRSGAAGESGDSADPRHLTFDRASCQRRA
jgi:hypothetical protein